jgi:ribosomal protein L37E
MVYMSMSACSRCGVTFHPELPKCPVCGHVRAREQNKRRKLWYLANTIVVTFVALVVGVRALTGGDIQVGMSESDCTQARALAEETRYALDSLSSDQERAIKELQEVSQGWSLLAGNYVPGKYSWSTSGREHNWLERLALSTSQLANGGQVKVEEVDNPVKYVSELTKLYPRFCS